MYECCDKRVRDTGAEVDRELTGAKCCVRGLHMEETGDTKISVSVIR